MSGELSGDIDFAGKVEVQDFRFTGTGAVQVTVVDQNGFPVPFVPVELEAFGGDLGSGFVAPAAQCFDFTDENGEVTFSASRRSCFSSEDFNLSGVPLGPCEARVLDFNSASPLGTAGPEDGCFVNQHGELVELTIEVAQPGDIDQVTVGQATADFGSGMTDVVEILIDYGAPLGSFFDLFIEIELDTDRNPGTGDPSFISFLSESAGFDPTNLGVDLSIGCFLNPFFGVPDCDVFNANGDSVNVEVELFPFGPEDRKLVMLINKAQLIAAGGPGPYNMALLSTFFGGFDIPSNIFGFGETLDVVPNGGNVEVDPNGFDQVFDDPLGDTFSDFVGE